MITEEIREARRKGLGGSDIAGIIPCADNDTGTLSPWMTQVQVWNSKLHPEDVAEKEGEQLWWGSQEEDLVAKRFSELTGKRVVNHNKMIVDGCLIANLDRLIIPDGQKIAAYHGQIRTNEIFEAKTSGSGWEEADAVQILSNGTEIKDGAVGVPVYYQCQLNHYLGRVPSAERIYVGVKMSIPCGRFSRTEFGIYVLERNDEIIKAQDTYAREWWQRHIVEGIRPDAVCEEDCKVLWRRSAPATHISVTPELLRTYKQLREAEVAAEAATRLVENAKTEIKNALGENEELLGNDGKTILATWKSSKDKIVASTDWESVARTMATKIDGGTEILDRTVKEFTVTQTKTGSRRFLVKKDAKVAAYVDTQLAIAELESEKPEPEHETT